MWQWKRNPKPRDAEVWDYYDNTQWWSRRLLVQVWITVCKYDTYYLNEKTWEFEHGWYPSTQCTLAHIRAWSQRWTR